MKENNLTDMDEASFVKAYSNPQKSAQIHQFMVENKLTDLDANAFYSAYFDPSKKKGGTQPASGAPQGQPTKPSAPSFGQKVVGEALTQEVQIPLKGQQKAPVQKKPYQDITYRREEMPSETTQAQIPQPIRTVKEVEKKAEQGKFIQSPVASVSKEKGTDWTSEEAIKKVNQSAFEKSQQVLQEKGVNLLTKEDIDNQIKQEYEAQFGEEIDGYMANAGHESDKFFPNHIVDEADLADLEIALGQREVPMGTTIQKEGKRGQMTSALMNDYFTYMKSVHPNVAEAEENKYRALKKSAGRSAKNEEWLHSMETRAIQLKMASVKRNLDNQKSAVNEYSQIEASIDTRMFDSGMIALNKEKAAIDEEYKRLNEKSLKTSQTPDFTALEARSRKLQSDYETLKVKSRMTDENVAKLQEAKNAYQQLGQSALSLKVLGTMNQDNINYYSEYSTLKDQIEKAQEAGKQRWESASPLMKMVYAPGELANTFASGIGDLALNIVQIPKVVEDLVTGNTEYNFLDEFYDGVENYRMEKRLDFPSIDSESTTQYLAGLGGNTLSSLAVFALGGSFGGASKMSQFGATFASSMLTTEVGAYEEAINTHKMSPRQAASASTAVAVATSLVEGLIPDIKYFEPSKFRGSMLNEIASGKSVSQAFRSAMPESAESYLLSGLKESGEELAQQTVDDGVKKLINYIGETEYFKDLLNGRAYKDAALGGLIGGGVGNFFKRPVGASNISEEVMLEAAENADGIIAAYNNNDNIAKVEQDLKGPRQDFMNLSAHPNWKNLDRPKKARAFGITQQIRTLEETNLKDPIINAQIERLKNERQEILSIGENGISAKAVGTSTTPQRVKIGGQYANFFINEDGDYEIEYNNGKSVIVDKGEGAADKIREMGIETDDGVIEEMNIENQNTLITPTLEKGATINYAGKNATLNNYAEKNGKIVSVNITTEDGKTLQIREGQQGNSKQLLENLNNLKYDKENETRVSGEVGKGQEPVAAKPVEVPSEEAPATGGVLQAQEEVDLKKVAVEKAQNQLDGVNSRINPKANYPLFNVGQKHDPGNKLLVINSEDRRTDTTKDGVEVITKIISPAEVDENGKMTKTAQVEIGTFDSYEQAQEYVNSQYNKYKAIADEKLAKANAELAATEAAPKVEEKPAVKTKEAPKEEPKAESDRRAARRKALQEEEAPVAETKTEEAPETKPQTESERRASRRQKMQEEGGTKISEAAPSVRRAGAVEASESSNEYAGTESALEGVGLNETTLDEWKEKNRTISKKPKIEELTQAVRALMSGKIKFKQYYEQAKKYMPSKLMEKVPTPASFKEIVGSVDKNKLKIGIINLNKFIKKGTKVGLRIDIPSFNRFGKYVVTVHDKRGSNPVIGYGSTGSIKNVNFKTSVSTAANIGAGEDKSAFAMAVGEWMDESPESIQARAEEALNSPEWVQVSMNPARNSFFFDKADGNPVIAADEVLQVGNLVLAKNPQKIDLNTKEGMAQFEKQFSAKTKEGVTYQYRKGQPESERRAARRAAMQPDIDKAIADIERGLFESGITVEVKDDADYNNDERIKGSQSVGSEGLFIADDGTIILNRDKLKTGLGKTIIFHEGVHPIINIIRNTDPKRYAQIIEGIKREAKRNPQMDAILKFATKEDYASEGEQRVEDELAAETFARIASGKLDVSKIDKSLRETIMSFINDALKMLGLPTIPLNAPDQEFRKAAQQISDLFNKGGKLSDIVGAENVQRYENNIAKESGTIETGSVVYAGQARISDEDENEIENPYRDSVDLPVRTLESLLQEYGDNVIVVNSDPTGLGTVRLPSGKVIELDGGIGYMAIKENVDDGVGFAASSDARVKFLYKTANQMNEDGKLKDGKVLVLVMVQKADSMLGNNYTPDYVADALAKIPQDVISKQKLTALLVDPLKKETFKSMFYKEANIPKMDEYKYDEKKTEKENEKLEKKHIKEYKLKVAQIVADNKKKKNEGLAKVESIKKQIESIDPRSAHDEMVKIFHELSFVQAQKYFDTILGSYTNKTTKYNLEISRLLYQYAGADQRNLFQVLGEKSLVDQLLKDPKSWGYAVAAFVHNTAKQNQKLGGIKHNLFNAKFQGDERYILAKAHKVNDIMTDFNAEQVRKVEEGGKKGAVFAEQQASQGMYPSGKAVIPSTEGVELKSLQQTKGRFESAKIQAQPSFGGREDIQNAYLDAMDAVDDAVDAGTSPAEAVADNVTSQDWYKSLSSQDKAQVDKMINNEFGEEIIKAPKAATKPKAPTGIAATISNIVDNYYKLKDGDRAEKSAARDAINQILDSDPKLKYIYDNIRDINKQLQAAGVITSKTDGCP